jgi:heme-degrading monooxygenase HmoA
MYARLTTVVFGEGEQNPIESGYDRTFPAIRELDGFMGMMVLSGIDERRFAILTLWETPEALAAAQPFLDGIRRAESTFRDVAWNETARYYVSGSSLDAGLT